MVNYILRLIAGRYNVPVLRRRKRYIYVFNKRVLEELVGLGSVGFAELVARLEESPITISFSFSIPYIPRLSLGS